MKKDLETVTKRVTYFLEYWEKVLDGSYSKDVYNRFTGIYNKSTNKIDALSTLVTIQNALKDKIIECGMAEGESSALVNVILEEYATLRLDDKSGHSDRKKSNLNQRDMAKIFVELWMKEDSGSIKENGGPWQAYLKNPLEEFRIFSMYETNKEALNAIIDLIIYDDYPDSIKAFEELSEEEQKSISSKAGRKLDHEAASQEYIENEVKKLVKKGGRYTKKDGTPKPTSIRDELINHSNITLGARALFDRVKRALHKMQ